MKRSVYVPILLFLLFAVTAGVSLPAAPPSDMAVSTVWLAEHEKDPNLVVLHVGVDRKAYDAGHIPGARFVPMSAITAIRNGVPNQTPAPAEIQKALENLGVGDKSFVVAYGDGPLLATHVYFLLDYIGHQHHAILDGGPDRWKAEKRTMTTAVPEFKPGTLSVKAHPELLLDLAAVQKFVAEKKTLLIDGRPADQYSGATPGEAIKRGGHIPGATNVFWMQALVSDKDPVLKPAAELRAMYEAAGAKPGKEFVVYCRTGLIAKNMYFTAKLAGLSPVVYDGSFLDWSKAEGTQVETGKGL